MAGALRRYDDQNGQSDEPCIDPSETGGPLTEAHAWPHHRSFHIPDRAFYNNAIANLMTAKSHERRDSYRIQPAACPLLSESWSSTSGP